MLLSLFQTAVVQAHDGLNAVGGTGSHLDVSRMEVVFGLIAGIGITGIISFLVLWALVKARVIRFGQAETAPERHEREREGVASRCIEHLAERERSIRNAELIEVLFQAIKEIREQITRGIEGLHSNQLRLLVGLVEAGVLPAKYVPEGIGVLKSRKE